MEANAILMRIREYMQVNKWTVYRLAKESELPYSSLNNLFRRNTEPTLPTLRKICNGLGVSLTVFLDDADTPITETYSQDERSLVELYRSIPKPNRTLFLAYGEGLAKCHVEECASIQQKMNDLKQPVSVGHLNV